MNLPSFVGIRLHHGVKKGQGFGEFPRRLQHKPARGREFYRSGDPCHPCPEFRGGRHVGPFELDLVVPHQDRGQTGLRPEDPEPPQIEESPGRFRQPPEPVRQLALQGVHLEELLGVGQPLVEGHLLLGVLHVVVGKEGVHLGGEPRLRAILQGHPLQLAHRLLHQPHVHLEPHRDDMPRLLATQDVPRPADLQIAHGQGEPAAQLVELGDGPQPLHGGLGEHPAGGHEKIAGRLLHAAPHPAAKLIELGQTEGVGAVDDHGVHRRNVEPALDDHGGHQHVDALLHELVHHLFQRPLRHLAVGHRHPELGHQLLHIDAHAVDGRHAVVHEEGLPAAVRLPEQRLLDQLPVELGDLRLHRHPALGRGLDHGDVAHAQQRHVQACAGWAWR